MLSGAIEEAKRILWSFCVALAVTLVGVVITPTCSDLGGVNPIYCLGGFGGTQKIVLVLGVLWIGLSLGLSWRAASVKQ